MQRALGALSLVALAVGAILLGRLALDLGRLHVALAVCVWGFYAGFVVVVGSSVLHLVRGSPPGAPIASASRWALVIAVPVALLASVLDCMGLDFSGCTPTCAALTRFVAPAVSLLLVIHAVTGARGWILTASAASFALLVPNCVCRNPVNRWWIQLLGQSPACYAGAFAVILLVITALSTRRLVVPALALAWGVVAAQLAFWIGHHYFHVPW